MQRRLILAVLALDEARGLAEHRRVVVAVHRDLDLVRREPVGELDLEVEARAGQDFGAVDRIDGLGVGRRDGEQGEGSGKMSGAWLCPSWCGAAGP